MISINYNTGNGSFIGVLFALVTCIILIAAMWKIFVKAGKPGWAVFVPFYGNYCQFDITFGCGWLFLLMFVPCVNFVVMFMLYFKLAKVFGKGVDLGSDSCFCRSFSCQSLDLAMTGISAYNRIQIPKAFPDGRKCLFYCQGQANAPPPSPMI